MLCLEILIPCFPGSCLMAQEIVLVASDKQFQPMLEQKSKSISVQSIRVCNKLYCQTLYPPKVTSNT